MSVLLPGRREALPFDLLAENQSDDLLSEALKGIFPDAQVQDLLAPKAELAEFLYLFSESPEGRAIVEWLLDITIRQPYRVMGTTIEETALWAAKREGMTIAGEMILAAIARGKQSNASRKSKPGATQ